MKDKMFSIVSNFKVKEIKELEDDNFIVVEGYANTTEKDRMGDIIVEEAWNKGGLDNYMLNPIVLAFHDHTKPVGQVIEHSVTNKGLKVVAKIFKAAGNVFDFVKDGMLKSFSVGFRVKDADYDEKSDIFVIKDLELLEISVVSVPANASSTFSVKKSFEKDTDYTEFKKQFEADVDDEVKTSESKEVEKTLEEKLQDTFSSALEKSSKELTNAVETLLKSKKEEKNNMTDVYTQDMVEKLLKDAEDRISKSFEEKFGEKEQTLSKALEDLRGDLNEKSEELASLQRNKMSFDDHQNSKVTNQEVDSAILLSKAMKRGVEHTKFGKQLIEKAGVSPHLGSTTDTWEEEFSMRLENDIRERLIMEPLFRKVQMNAATMHIPINPEAGYGQWIARTYPPMRSTDGASTGTAVDHEITDTVLAAHKLVAKEYLGDEEEEDSILPLMPIVRDAVMRRMAKGADVALLRGDVGVASPGAGNYPFNGVATIAADAGGGQQTTVSIAGPNAVTVANLQTARRGLGVWGHNPLDLIYIVSHDAYYDLLEDPDFRTVDMVGDNATILRGQIGFANGSPVVVSGEFAAKAAGQHAVVCLNASNFIVGQLRNTRVETDRSVEDQRNVIVASRRMGFLDLISGKGASVITWAA